MTDEGAGAAESRETLEIVETTDDGLTAEAVVAEDDVALPADEDIVVVAESTPTARSSLLVPALIGALIAALAGAGFFGWKFWQHHQLDQARDEAQRAAVAYAQVLTSVDSNNVDENFKQVLDGATGEFKDMYSKSSVELRQLLIENKATAHGVVVDSAVQSASKDNAVVLLFVDQSVANTKLPDPRIDRSRMKMTLEKADGTWRASKIELP
ncbi:MAG: tetratricopeptide repeat protein [Mycobacterium sp.]|nr:tetratricopeptide repeat protein [Mycobacterium sp.]